MVAVAPEPGRKRLKNPAAAKGTAALDRSVVVPVIAPGPVEALCGTGGEMDRPWPILCRHRRKYNRRTIKMAKPATPPTTPPTTAGVDGELLPPDPAAADDDADGVPPAAPVAPPTPPPTPAPPPVPDGIPVELENEDIAAEDVEEDVKEDKRVLVAKLELGCLVLDVSF